MSYKPQTKIGRDNQAIRLIAEFPKVAQIVQNYWSSGTRPDERRVMSEPSSIELEVVFALQTKYTTPSARYRAASLMRRVDDIARRRDLDMAKKYGLERR